MPREHMHLMHWNLFYVSTIPDLLLSIAMLQHGKVPPKEMHITWLITSMIDSGL
jgi:hypothetical protein